MDTGTASSTGSTANSTGDITVPTSTSGDTTNTITQVTNTGTEFQQALSRMYTNGITKYNTESTYRANDSLTREEFAKMISLAYSGFGYDQTDKGGNCGFIDTGKATTELLPYITSACQRGLFKGTQGKFLPRNTITRPEVMAILIRMFEGKSSLENRNPRRGDYYLKARALGLTTINNQTAFDKAITRKEVAIYLLRLNNIISNESLRIMALNKIGQFSNTGTQQDTSGILSNFETLASSISVSDDPELKEAISWMNDNGLTSYKTIADYQPFTVLDREQAAKILTNFGILFQFIGTNNGALPPECIFKDINNVDASLLNYVETACQNSILKGTNGTFLPKGTINKAQFITAIMRLFEGKNLDENVSPRWKNYFEKAQSMGIVAPADLITFENPITRYEVALFLYRFKVKFQMLQNINTNKVQNQVVSMVPDSTSTGINSFPEGNAYVDMNLLEDGNFDVGYIEAFGTRYKIVKSTTEKYFSDNFVRYGDLYTLDSDEKTGSVNFIVSNGNVVDATIRTVDKNYEITQIKDTSAYYKIKQTK